MVNKKFGLATITGIQGKTNTKACQLTQQEQLSSDEYDEDFVEVEHRVATSSMLTRSRKKDGMESGANDLEPNNT